MKNLIKASTVSLVALTLLFSLAGSAMALSIAGPLPSTPTPTKTWEEYKKCKELSAVGMALPCSPPVIKDKPFVPGTHGQGKLCKVKVQVQCVKAPCLAQWKWVTCSHPNHRPMHDDWRNGGHHGWDNGWDRNRNHDHHRRGQGGYSWKK